MAYSVQEIKEKIGGLSSLYELNPKEYCCECGMADSLVKEFEDESLKFTQLRRVFYELRSVYRDVRKECRNKEDWEKKISDKE